MGVFNKCNLWFSHFLCVQDQETYDDISQTVDSPSHHYENHGSHVVLTSECGSTQTLSSSLSTCFGARRKISNCIFNSATEQYKKKYKFWLNLLLAEEWNYFYLLKDKLQSYDEQEKHIKRLTSTSKLSATLHIYFDSFIPLKLSSTFHRTLCLNHYERLHCLFNSLLKVIHSDNDYTLCSNVLQRLTYLITKIKAQQYENTFIQFPAYSQRTLSLSSVDNYQTLNIMSKDKQTLIEQVHLHLILGVNIQRDKYLLVLSVEQPQGSNTIHNFHFAHADRSIINEWFQLLDNYVKQAKRDYMNKYQEYRI